MKKTTIIFKKVALVVTLEKNKIIAFSQSKPIGYFRLHNTFLCRYDCKAKNPEKGLINYGEKGLIVNKLNRGVMNSNACNIGKNAINLKSYIGEDFFKSGISQKLKTILGGYIKK